MNKIIGCVGHLRDTLQTFRRCNMTADEVYIKSILNSLNRKRVAPPLRHETNTWESMHEIDEKSQKRSTYKTQKTYMTRWNPVKSSQALVRNVSPPLESSVSPTAAPRTLENMNRECKHSLQVIEKLPPKNIKSYLSINQTPAESVILLRQWFEELELNELVRIVPSSSNLAAYVPKCFTLSQLVKLGVDISKIEEIPGVANMLVKLDFHTDVEPVLWQLADFGFKPEQIARVITVFPKILKLSLDEINSRVSYFTDRQVSPTDVVKIICKHPTILSKTSVDIDKHLGQVKMLYVLKNKEIVDLITTESKIIVHPLPKIKDVYVILSKMMGFPQPTIQKMILTNPKLLVTERDHLSNNFTMMHWRLNLPIDVIPMWPEALSTAPHILYQRCTFLVRRNLFQPDPTKPLYTPLSTVVAQTDEEFCQKYGFTTENDYDDFLRTL
uniref:mTERF domain-containing protein, mitochondrial n=1 Tax=Trichobilharzia regenti TaxID=157069 RepID=A0AA85JEZ1_TRIRE|nr:unnamed protein product [Trichobilharzia regenti]